MKSVNFGLCVRTLTSILASSIFIKSYSCVVVVLYIREFPCYIIRSLLLSTAHFCFSFNTTMFITLEPHGISLSHFAYIMHVNIPKPLACKTTFFGGRGVAEH